MCYDFGSYIVSNPHCEGNSETALLSVHQWKEQL